MRALDELHAFHRELGLPAAAADRRARSAAGSRRLTPRLRGAVHVPTDHSVDARALHAALLAAASAAGVDARAAADRRGHCREWTGGRAHASTDGSVVRAGTVVLALGARAVHAAGRAAAAGASGRWSDPAAARATSR